MFSRTLRRALAMSALGLALCAPALAQDAVKIGMILPLTGPFASTGKQIEAAARLYMQQHGTTVAGRKIELIVRDDTGTAPETTKRIAQELIVQQKVNILAGFGLTPLAFAAAPVATEAKVPMIVMAAATSVIPQRSPFIVRTGFTLPQITGPIADWARKNKINRVVTMVADYGPGLDAEKTFVKRFTDGGGTIVESIRTPLSNPDFAPFLQRAKDAKPDALFVFVPAGQGTAVMKQFAERGLAEAGIRLIGTGDVTDDDILDSMGSPALGVVTSFHYSAAHPSPENKAYVAEFMKANNGMRPNFHSVGGYDGMHLIYEALKKTGGDTDGEKLLAAMKGMAWVSPRGPMSIDPDDPRRRADRLHPQGGDSRRQAVEHRIRQGRATSRTPADRRPPGQTAPQTSRAVSTTRRSFAACASTGMSLPCTVLENPHCGDRHIWSSGMSFAAAVDAPLEVVLRFELVELGADQAQHDDLALRHVPQRREVAGARVVVFEEIAVDGEFVEQHLGHRLVAAFRRPRALEVAAAQVHADASCPPAVPAIAALMSVA